ncbi:FtsX-like permease family protein [Streptomyces sp. SYSU K217416]
MSWADDLRMGARFAVTGGREGWTRTLLTAVGVGLGVALLLFTTAVPSALGARDQRGDARNDFGAGITTGPAADTMLVGRTDSTYDRKDVRGRLLLPEGDKAPVPPGLAKNPGAGEMVVSPALADLLDSSSGELLRERLDYRVIGTITDEGLLGPHELAYYAGSDVLKASTDGVERINAFAPMGPAEEMDPVLALFVVIIFVVLLMPVAVFIAAAVRFGGDRRDRRLAALRLVGADGRMTRRIAAGEALAGSLLGLFFGAGFFLLGRQFVGDFTVAGLNVFPADVDPSPALAALVGVAVPAAALAVTLFALRGVVIEPLGVVRSSVPRRRRVWWRLVPPLAGLALLYPLMGQGRDGGDFNQWQVTGGVVLLLVGVTALLPWLVEFVVARLGGGTVAWQLAVRRLQLTSGTAARLVNGIAVAVAGAIALQMLFAGIQGDYTRNSGMSPDRANLAVSARDLSPAQTQELSQRIKAAEGVRDATALAFATLSPTAKDPAESLSLTIGDCAALKENARIGSCRDGDIFLAEGGDERAAVAQHAQPGSRLVIDPSYSGGGPKGAEIAWTVPADARRVPSRPDPTGYDRGGVLATPGALAKVSGLPMQYTLFVKLDPRESAAADRVRNLAYEANPLAYVMTVQATETSTKFASVRKGLFIGAAGVLMLIGASLLVSMLEQLRERKRLLSALVAFGTRRTTLSWSILWQTAVPVALGLALSCAVGLGLGSVLLKMAGTSFGVDWMSVATMAGIGAGVVLLVTALSLPPLWRLMRPDGLRTE